MIEIKKSKKFVLLVSLLICLLSVALVAMGLHIMSVWSLELPDKLAVTKIEVQYNTSIIYGTWKNESLEINVTIKNELGQFPYYNATVTVYVNETIIDTRFVAYLYDDTERTEKFEWNFSDISTAWPYQVYTIKTNATIASLGIFEYNLEDNELVYGDVTFGWSGDANCDGHVDEIDNDIVNDHFNSAFPDPNYDASADFNGDGKVNGMDSDILDYNLYTGPIDGRDILVTGIFPVTYPTWNPSFNLTFGVTVRNRGWNYTENFTLTIYNGTYPNTTDLIAQQDVTLAPETEEIVKFTLKCPSLRGYPDNSSDAPWPYRTHKIWVNATIVPNETVTEDNFCNSTIVTVRWPGDANEDGHVNQTDLEIVASLLGKGFPDPEYDSRVDFNCDGLIDIVDVLKAATDPHWHNGPLDYCDIEISYVKLRLPSHPEIPLSVAYSNSTYSIWTINVLITVKNNGNTTEGCTTRAYYRINNNDWIVIGNTSVTVAPNKTITATIPWEVPTIDGKPYGEYEVKANTTVIEWEDDPHDNEELDGTVTIRWIGDATNNYKIDIEDLRMLRNAIGGYNIEVDFNGNGEIDLDDVAQLTDNWGQVPKA
jgi:hypothetical protein